MEGPSGLQDYVSFFNDQTIFFTSATGGLGGCPLFKLVAQPPTKKVHVLCRSESKARQRGLLSHINSILNSGRMKLGDILRLNFAMALDLLAEIAAQTTIVIHSVRILYCLILDF